MLIWLTKFIHLTLFQFTYIVWFFPVFLSQNLNFTMSSTPLRQWERPELMWWENLYQLLTDKISTVFWWREGRREADTSQTLTSVTFETWVTHWLINARDFTYHHNVTTLSHFGICFKRYLFRFVFLVSVSDSSTNRRKWPRNFSDSSKLVWIVSNGRFRWRPKSSSSNILPKDREPSLRRSAEVSCR